MLLSVILFLVLSLCVAWVVLWLRRTPRDVPWAEGWFPVIGHMLPISKDLNGFIESQVVKFGGAPFMIQILNRVICILSEEHIRIIQRAKDVELSMNGVFEDLVGLDIWDRPPKRSDDHTHVQVLKTSIIPRRAQFVPVFCQAVARVTRDRMAGKDSVTFGNFMDDYALYVVCEAVLCGFCGPEIGTNKELQRAFIEESRISESIVRMSIIGLPRFLVKRRVKKYASSRAIIDKILLPEIEKRRVKGQDETKGDFLDALIFWHTDPSPELCVAYFSNAMFAALMTTRQTLAQTVLDLAARPEIQERLRAEVHKEMAGRGGGSPIVTADVVNHLRLMEASIRESMRMRVGGFLPFRRLEVDLALPDGKGVVPKGFFVAMAASSIHKSDACFGNASEYNPDRWLVEDSVADAHLSFLNFGAGAHKCPGRMFALMEIKTILATVLLDYQFFGGTLKGERGDQRKVIPITMAKLSAK